MQFYVYLLRCSDGSYYAGHTDNLEGRLWQREQGICCDWTSRRRPVELVWCGSAPTRDEALAFERRIKGWARAKKEALIASDWDRINWLSRKPAERPVRPERNAEREVERRPAQTSEQRTSTSLRTNEVALGSREIVSPERSVQRAVEGRPAQTSEQRPSTSLRTTEVGTSP